MNINCALTQKMKSREIWGKLGGHAAFFREFLRSPRQIGSICQSGSALSTAIVQSALGPYFHDDSLIVDLGAGTGVISERLLMNGVDPRHILAIDASAGLSRLYAGRFRDIRLIVNDASNLNSIIDSLYVDMPVHAIISSLPLRSLPDRKVTAIMAAIRSCLASRGGVLVQYTYALWLRSYLCKYGFVFCSRQTVYSNLPPAIVEVYRPAP